MLQPEEELKEAGQTAPCSEQAEQPLRGLDSPLSYLCVCVRTHVCTVQGDALGQPVWGSTDALARRWGPLQD